MNKSRFILIIACLPFFSWKTKSQPTKKPNIIIILADDLGYEDLGFQGCKDIPTPNIDQLASEGVIFTSGYVSMSFCSPSRASLISGRYSQRFGYETNPNPILADDQGMPENYRTVFSQLQELGYVTGAIGKWHLGTSEFRQPKHLGFTEFFGFLGGAHDYFSWQETYESLPKRPWPEWFVNHTQPIIRQTKTGLDTIPQSGYLTHRFSKEAVEFVNHHSKEPFCLYLAYNAPHSPIEAPKDIISTFDPAKMKILDGYTVEQRITYASMILEMDKGIGGIMEALKKTGIDKNTIVFFLSDNGGGKPSAAYPSSNYPLKGYKGQFYEGGIRVPFVARWNGVFTGGSKYNEPVISMDITATALALAGGNPDESKLDGKNLIPYIIGKKTTAPHERLFWRASEGKDGAIRKGNYKLKFTKSGGSVELYNLTTDIGEQHDMSNEQPELVKTLLTEWKAWNIELKPSAWRIVPEKEWTQPRYQPPLWKEEKK